jgi:hypothetical protein
VKHCSTCHQPKPESEFGKNARMVDGLARSCKPCSRQLKREAYYRNHDANKQKMRERPREQTDKYNLQKRLKTYGLTMEELEEMRERQQGRCGICSEVMQGGRGKGSEHVDHDHETGEVRSLLCNDCNAVIGHAREHPDILIAAAAYLISYSKERV